MKIDQQDTLSIKGHSHRRWFQYSLRTLLIGSVLFSFIAAWYGNNYLRIKTRDDKITQLRSLGCRIVFDYELQPGSRDQLNIALHEEPLLVRLCFGQHAYANIDTVQDKNGTFASESEFRMLSQFPQVRQLSLCGYQYQKHSLEYVLQYAPQIKGLFFNFSDVPNQDLALIGNFKKLNAFHVGGAMNLNDQRMEFLSRASLLNYLTLCNATITDNGMKSLANLSNLEKLSLIKCTIPESSFLHLKSLSKLNSIRLSGSKVNNQTVASIADAIPHAQGVWLDGTDITDGVIDELIKFKNLEYLAIEGTAISEAEVKNLTRLKSLKNVSLDATISKETENLLRSQILGIDITLEPVASPPTQPMPGNSQ